MRSLIKHSLLAVLAVTCAAQPAMADKFVYYSGDNHHRGHDWDRRGHDRHWDDRRGRGRDRRVNVYIAPRPYVERNIYVNNGGYYSSASYSEVRCTNDYNPLGMLLGGAAGGIVGNSIGKGKGNTAAIITGAVLGSAVGGRISQHCDQQVFRQVPVGVPVSWQGNDGYYNVTPTREYQTAGRYCREYQANATVGGRRQQTYGTACMQPDGSWEVIN